MSEDKRPEEYPEDQMDQLDRLLDEELLKSSPLNRSLDTLPKVHVPSDFLPGVMSKVYTHHARTKINLSHAVLILVGLLGLATLFFIWDTQSFMEQNSISSFNQALGERMDLMLSNFSNTAESTAKFLSAAWQIVSATGKALLAKPIRLLYLVFALVLLGGLIYVRKWIIKR